MPHLDYGDIIYDQPNNQPFSNKLEVVQYNELFEVHQRQVYQELGLESLKSCRWLKHLCCFYKIKKYDLPEYLSKIVAASYSKR